MRISRLLFFLSLIAICTVSASLVYAKEKHSIPTTYTIQPQDNLWSIAAEKYPHDDTRKMVWEIEQLNHINNVIQVGQEIVLP